MHAPRSVGAGSSLTGAGIPTGRRSVRDRRAKRKYQRPLDGVNPDFGEVGEVLSKPPRLEQLLNVDVDPFMLHSNPVRKRIEQSERRPCERKEPARLHAQHEQWRRWQNRLLVD